MQHRIGKLALCAAAAAVAALHAPPAHALRVATWNLLAYDETAAPSRRPPMLQILPGLDPDVMIVQELLTPPAVHFKAGDGTVPSDSSTRTAECTSLLGYTRLTESQADNDGRLKDPFNMTSVWNNPSYAPYHSQSPCAGAGCVGSSGGWTTASTCCSAPIR